jgi:hypothetical protein
MDQKDCTMKKLAAALAAMAVALTSTVATAGGPVIVEDDTVVEAASPRSGWIVPVVVGLILVCALACGSDEEAAPLE